MHATKQYKAKSALLCLVIAADNILVHAWCTTRTRGG